MNPVGSLNQHLNLNRMRFHLTVNEGFESYMMRKEGRAHGGRNSAEGGGGEEAPFGGRGET